MDVDREPRVGAPAAEAAATRVSADAALARLTMAPALLLVAWLAVGLPLLGVGEFGIGLTLALFVPVAALVLTIGLWRAPLERWEGVSWWTVGGVAAVATGFLVLQLMMCSEQIVVRRDPASYVQFATWIADRGSLPIPESLWAFGAAEPGGTGPAGRDPALSFASPAFYEVGAGSVGQRSGAVIVPQFMAGLPVILTLGHWLGGTYALLVMAPILGTLAILSFAGLTARLVSPRWAPLGALALALTLPMMFVSRATYSEAAALVLLLVGLSLVLDSQGRTGRAAQLRVALGGLSLGLIVAVRIDGLRDVLPVVVFAGLLYALRRRTAVPLLLGLVVGAGAGLVEGYALSRPYLEHLHDSLMPLLVISSVLAAGTAVGAVLLRRPAVRRRLPRPSRGRLPDLAAVLTVLVVAGFAVRPYVQTVRRSPRGDDDRLNVAFIAMAQRAAGLPVDGTRQYSELSLYWVSWYIGMPALLLATFGAALLVRRILRRREPYWTLPYAMIVWTTVTTLWRPGITPDHPWASRRLITVVIPGLLLFALWALWWGRRYARRLGYGRRVAGVVTLVGAVLLVVPIVATSGGLMFTKTEQGEVAAVRGMCRQIGQGASVVIVERVTGDRFSQVIRGMCQLPVARISTGSRQDVERVIGKIREVGRRPVILGRESGHVRPYTTPYAPARRILHVVTRQDEHALVDPPNATWGLTMTVWMAAP